MNIEHAREVQKSILDESRIFNMSDWCDCIAGHAYRCATGHTASTLTIGVEEIAQTYLELHFSVCDSLFRSRNYDRMGAVLRLEELIQAEQRVNKQTWPQGSSRDRLALARPRSEAVEAEAAETVEPELELVGV